MLGDATAHSIVARSPRAAEGVVADVETLLREEGWSIDRREVDERSSRVTRIHLSRSGERWQLEVAPIASDETLLEFVRCSESCAP